MSEPTEGPYEVDDEGDDMIVITSSTEDVAEVFDNDDFEEQLATARLLAKSWEMRKYIKTKVIDVLDMGLADGTNESWAQEIIDAGQAILNYIDEGEEK